MSAIKLGRYKHYKNKHYNVVGFAHHTDTQEKMVIYMPLYDTPEDLIDDYGDDLLFVRSYQNFVDTVTIDGVDVPRYELIEEEAA